MNIPEYVKIENYNFKDTDDYGKVISYTDNGLAQVGLWIHLLNGIREFHYYPSVTVTAITEEEYDTATILES